MLDVTTAPARVQVWVSMAEQFLDNETRQDIPLIALYCLQAGLSVAAAREVWCFEVTPAVGVNLWNIAGEWAGWDREWLLPEIARARQSWPNRSWARWPRYAARLPIAHCYWRAIARCMQVLLRFPESERERAAGDLATLAGQYFDMYSPDFRTLRDDELQRCAALYPEPFVSALRPAVFFCQDVRAADRRVRAALQRGSRWRPPAIDLRSHFAQALERVGATRSGRELLDQLVVRYGESHRHYHTLEHISACLGWLDGHAALAQRPAEIALAIWFHDAVYDPRASDNESRSAELAREQLRALGVAENTVDRIASLVLATREHLATDKDAQLLIDIDLTILGTSPELFDDFEQRIRREYAHVQPFAFGLGRRRVLWRLLERDRIYQTPALHEELEVRARANLERRMRELVRVS